MESSVHGASRSVRSNSEPSSMVRRSVLEVELGHHQLPSRAHTQGELIRTNNPAGLVVNENSRLDSELRHRVLGVHVLQKYVADDVDHLPGVVHAVLAFKSTLASAAAFSPRSFCRA